MSGSWAMKLADGSGDVRITATGYSSAGPAAAHKYMWPDAVYVGEVIALSQHDEKDNWFHQNHSRIFTLTPLKGFKITEKMGSKKPRLSLKIGDICPVCGKEYKVRELATSTYIGCWCKEEE